MVVYWVVEDLFDSYILKLCCVYVVWCDVMLVVFDCEMLEGVDWMWFEGGMFVWLILFKGLDGKILLEYVVQIYWVVFVSGGVFFVDGLGGNIIWFSYSLFKEEVID